MSPKVLELKARLKAKLEQKEADKMSGATSTVKLDIVMKATPVKEVPKPAEED